MNKKAGVSLLLKFIIGLVIAIMVIWILISLVNKYILFGASEDRQKVYFEKLSAEIKNLKTSGETSQIMDMESNALIVSFNNKDTEVNLKDIEIYSGYKKDVRTVIKKPVGCIKNCLCLCKTKDDKVLFEGDCLQGICEEHDEEIYNNENPFFIFGKGMTSLLIKKEVGRINIKIMGAKE